MASPVVLVLITIRETARETLRSYGRLLGGARNVAEGLVDKACNSGLLGYLCLPPLACALVFAFGIALVVTLVAVGIVSVACTLGICVCAAFAAIALLHFPILMNMLTVLNCEYDGTGNVGVMQRMPTQPCWQGRHWIYALASVFTIMVLYPVMLHFERKRQSAAEVSYHVRFTSCMLIGKLALSAMSALLVSTLPPSAYLICCGAILLFFLHATNIQDQDQPACCNVRSVRLARSCILTCALWSVATTLAATILDWPDGAFLLILLALWLGSLSYFVTITHLKQHEPAYNPRPFKDDVLRTLHEYGAPSHAPPGGGGGGGVGAAAAPDETPGRKTRPVPPSGALDSPMPGQQTPGGATKTPSGRRVPPATPWSEAPPAAASRELRDVYLAAGPPAVRPLVWFYEHDDGFDLSWSEDTTDVVPIVLSVEPPSAPPHHAAQHQLPPGAEHDELHAGDAIVAVNGERGFSKVDLSAILAEPELHAPLRLTVRRAAVRRCAAAGERNVKRSRTRVWCDSFPASATRWARVPHDKRGPAPRPEAGEEIVYAPLSEALGASNELGRDEHAALHHSLHYGDGWGLRSGLRLHHFVKVAGGGYMKPEISLKALSQCMMLYPQDAELQTNGCERLCRAVIESSASKTLKELIKEINASLIVPIVINTMEVHAGNHRVITPAARLLGAFASMNGWLRANLVAAGVLPALCASLQLPPADKANGGGKEAAEGTSSPNSSSSCSPRRKQTSDAS